MRQFVFDSSFLKNELLCLALYLAGLYLIIITQARLGRRKLCFYTFAGPWAISVSQPLGK
jgi:hypothetical protein